MKKGLIILLFVIVLAVLITPGIIGRIAERSVDENLLWAMSQNGDFEVTSTDFRGSWFSSSGRHRFELQRGELYDALFPGEEGLDPGELPALIVDTRLDHGVVPVTSLARDGGSLLPALGNAISTLGIELPDGDIIPLPGTVYTIVGLGGSLQSRVAVKPGELELAGNHFDWGGSEFVVSTSVRRGGFGLAGVLSSLALETEDETTVIGDLRVDIDLETTRYGYMVGPATVSLASVEVIAADQTITAGPLYLDADSSVSGEHFNGEVEFSLDALTAGPDASGSVQLLARLEDVAAPQLGDLMNRLDAGVEQGTQDALLHLMAQGMEIHFDQFDVSTPFGEVTSRFGASVAPADEDNYDWSTVVMATEASADISVPQGMVDIASATNPQVIALVGMGFLRKQGEYYVMAAALKQGLLTVNGAPMPLPLSSL